MTIALYLTDNGYLLCGRHAAQWEHDARVGHRLAIAGIEYLAGDECCDCADAASTYPQPIANLTRTLANGERWELRGERWYMLGGDTYTPVSAVNFEAYAATVESGERRAQCAGER